MLGDMCMVYARGFEYGRAKRFFNFTEASSDFHRINLMNVYYTFSATGALLESDIL